MLLGPCIVLLLQAAAAAPEEERALDLATLAPDVLHDVAVPAERPLSYVIEHRVPGARYRAKNTGPTGSSSETIWAPHRLRDGSAQSFITTGPGCEEAIAAIDSILAASDEPSVAAARRAATSLVAASPCPAAPRALKYVTDQTRYADGGGLLEADETASATLERLDPVSGATQRRWRFRFVATGAWRAPPGWSAPNEVTWLVREIVRDIAEMAVLARQGGARTLPTVDVVAVSPPARFSVKVSEKGRTGRTRTLNLAESAWTPGSYETLARELVGSVGARSATPSAEPPALEALTDPRGPILEREDRRLSERLTAHPREPAAHEAAALLLASIGLREAAGTFTDVRLTLARLTAHLTMAAALRGRDAPGPDGRLAEIARLTLLGRQADALDALSRLRAPTASEQAWVTALRLRNTADWRLLDSPLTGTLLERLEYHRALVDSVGGSRPLAAFRGRNQERIPDWGRALSLNVRSLARGSTRLVGVVTAGPDVESGNVFVSPLLQLEIEEATTVLGASRGLAVAASALPDVLNEPPTRCVTSDTSGHLRARVFGPGNWSRYYQRHLAHAIVQTFAHVRGMLGLPKQADALWTDTRSALRTLVLMPLVQAGVIALTPREDRSTARQDRSIEDLRPRPEAGEICASAASLWEGSPDVLTTQSWHVLLDLCRAVPGLETSVLKRSHRWFGSDLPGATAFDVERRMSLGHRDDDAAVARIERLRSMAPRNKDLLAVYFQIRYLFKGGRAEFEETFAPLMDYDVAVMRKHAGYLREDADAYAAAMTRVAKIEPDAWLTLGRYLARHERTEEAVRAYEAAVETADDRVAVANDSEWLVLQYLGRHLDDKAIALAMQAADTGSSAGLQTMARLQERLGNWDAAQRYYRQNADRYADTQPLDAFYLRRQRKAGNEALAAEVEQARARLFPRGRLQMTDVLRKHPPSWGVEIAESPGTAPDKEFTAGTVIVAADGFAIDDLSQYWALVSLVDDEPSTIVVWQNGSYREITAALPRPQPLLGLRSYKGGR